jgi:rod shape-determining protein MreB
MIIEIGGGTSEIAVISLGGIVANTSVRIGGTKLDAAIQEFVRKKYNLAIGDRTSEDLKIQIGSALPLKEPMSMNVRGRDVITGLPRTATVTSDDITEAIQGELHALIEAVKSVLQQTPPELAADVIDKGMVLSGGSGQLRNLDELLSRATDVPAYVADDCLLNVALGTGVALENLESYKRSIMENR